MVAPGEAAEPGERVKKEIDPRSGRQNLCRPLRGLGLFLPKFPRLGGLAWGYHSVRLLRRLVELFNPSVHVINSTVALRGAAN